MRILTKAKGTYVFFITTLIFLLSACSVRLISPYDPIFVAELYKIQKQTNVILLEEKQKFKTPTKNSDYKNQYLNIMAEIEGLVSKEKAIPNNEITFKQLILLRNTLKDVEKLHQKGFDNIEEVNIAIETLNAYFTEIYRLQNLKKAYL